MSNVARLPKGQTELVMTGNSLQVMTMQAAAEPHRQLLNLRGKIVNNHPCYLYCYWLCLIYNTTVNILYIYDVYIVTMICSKNIIKKNIYYSVHIILIICIISINECYRVTLVTVTHVSLVTV